MKGLIYFLISPFLFSVLMSGHPITIDGQFHDWDNVLLTYSDIEGDGIGADFADIKLPMTRNSYLSILIDSNNTYNYYHLSLFDSSFLGISSFY